MSKRLSAACILLFGALICFACPVSAQLSGHNSRGDYGLQSGSQAPPGWYLVAPMYYRYSADEFRDRNGDRFNAIDDGRSVEATAWLPAAIWVSEHKVLGGNYSFVIFPGVTNNALEFPPTGVDERVSTGLADLYVQPINLGWTTRRADFIAGIGILAPTGEYEAGGSSNRGLGIQLGTSSRQALASPSVRIQMAWITAITRRPIPVDFW